MQNHAPGCNPKRKVIGKIRIKRKKNKTNTKSMQVKLTFGKTDVKKMSEEEIFIVSFSFVHSSSLHQKHIHIKHTQTHTYTHQHIQCLQDRSIQHVKKLSKV